MKDGDSIELAYFADKKNGTVVKDWYDQVDGGIRVGSPGDLFTPVKNMTLYPRYEKAVNITYCPDGEGIKYLGYNYTPTQDPLFPGQNFTVVPDFPGSSAGYFAGWTDGTNTYFSNKTYVVPDEDLGLSPIWKDSGYDVRYILSKSSVFLGKGIYYHQGSISPGTQFTILGEDDFPIPDPSQNVVFAGWNDGDKVYQPGEMYIMKDHSVQFTSVWTENPHTVTYDLDGGVYENQKETIEQDLVASGMFFKLPPSIPTKHGYLFEGWSDGLNLDLYQPGDKYNVTEKDVVMKAIWKQGVTVTFDSQGGRIYPEFITGTAGEDVILPTSVNAYKDQASFIGWSTKPTSLHSDALDSFKFPDSDVVLYAIWDGGIDEPSPEPTDTPSPTLSPSVSCSVTYDLAGGIGADAPKQQSLLNGTTFIVKDMPDDVKLPGHYFAGWYYTGAQKTYLPGDLCVVGKSDIVLSAIWKQNETPVPSEDPDVNRPYRFVTFVDYDGFVIVKKAVEPGDPIPPIRHKPIKSGFLFKGWLLSDGTPVPNGYCVMSDIILQADFLPLPVLSGTSDQASIVDALILLQYTGNSGPMKDVSEEDMVSVADFNEDNTINLLDVLFFLKAL